MSRSLSRRSMLAASGAAAAGAAVLATASLPQSLAAAARSFTDGAHQAGIATAVQDHLVFATFDLTTNSPADLERLLVTWTGAIKALVVGQALAGSGVLEAPPADTGEAAGSPAAGLTVTVGFGPALFEALPALQARRPALLQELPSFPGDQLDPGRSGGAICLQACAQDPIVAFHAVRNLARLGLGTVALRAFQVGTGRTTASGRSEGTPRNLLGFKDGTNNLVGSDQKAMDRYVWVGDETDQAWLRGGTYLVARRIRTHLEVWSSLSLDAQQQVIGRFRASGAPLSGRHEHDAVNLDAVNNLAQPLIAPSAHIRVAAPSLNGGTKILRRGYNFTDGVDPKTGELDAGLFFICFQKNPTTQFVALQARLAANDALSNYTTHTSSALFAIPPAPTPGSAIGAALFS